jgi:hypothetical protein
MNNIKQVLILLLMPFMGFVYANRVIMRDYNKVDVYHFDSLEHLTENLFSNNGKATINVIIHYISILNILEICSMTS